jgi:DNA polymerase
MPLMSSGYDQLLAATIRHLENLQAQGVRHVAVAPETLRALSSPVARPAPTAAPVNPARPAATIPAPVASPARPAPVVPMPKPVTPIAKPLPVGPNFVSTNPDKAAAFASLRERVMVCVQCPHLAVSRKTIVFGVGNIDSPLMFVGEAPGADEDELGEPFVGKAGQLLTKIIETMALKRGDVYIANILKCRPDTPGQAFGNRKPTSDEMATCLPYLHEQIDLIKPKVLVALGATAVEGLLGKTVGITKLRGNWQTYRGIPLMPTYHPAYLLRNQALSEKRRVWEDMLQVMEKLELPITERQRNFFTKS